MLPSHYAPGCRVELVAADRLVARACALVAAGTRVAVLATGPTPSLEVAADLVVLPPAPSVEEQARTLYRRLRDADDAGAEVLLAVPPPPEGLGLAVADRLRRAAAPRPLPG
jgi:L-threonylcarbamoyladenylate synthase